MLFVRTMFFLKERKGGQHACISGTLGNIAVIKESAFGNTGGTAVRAITVTNANGLSAKLISFGARLAELWVPAHDGMMDDIVLGFDSLPEYEATDTYFGATCGRYGNRIARGRFMLDGIEYQLNTNEGKNHLHGGKNGFDRKNWTADCDPKGHTVTFSAISEDGEMGFPGRAELRSIYTLDDNNRLTVTMEATTDKPTLMNMVHHSYFNLAGQGSGNVLDQEMRLAAQFYTPVDGELLATGEVLSVTGTPFDFRKAKKIGADLDALASVGAGVFEVGGGYDHNWCLDGAGTELRLCAEVRDRKSGRRMTLHTTEPGVQFYTGGYLSEKVMGKRGKPLCKYAGFTLETQKFPGTPNFAHFPDCVLRPGQTYRQRMVFHFSPDKGL
jgi:aldose 1-epimerase